MFCQRSVFYCKKSESIGFGQKVRMDFSFYRKTWMNFLANLILTAVLEIWRSEVKSLSRVQLFATPWTVAHQAPPSMGFSRQEYWSRVAISFSRRSSWPRDWTRVSRIVGRRFTVWATREVFWRPPGKRFEGKELISAFDLHPLHGPSQSFAPSWGALNQFCMYCMPFPQGMVNS